MYIYIHIHIQWNNKKEKVHLYAWWISVSVKLLTPDTLLCNHLSVRIVVLFASDERPQSTLLTFQIFHGCGRSWSRNQNRLPELSKRLKKADHQLKTSLLSYFFRTIFHNCLDCAVVSERKAHHIGSQKLLSVICKDFQTFQNLFTNQLSQSHGRDKKIKDKNKIPNAINIFLNVALLRTVFVCNSYNEFIFIFIL